MFGLSIRAIPRLPVVVALPAAVDVGVVLDRPFMAAAIGFAVLQVLATGLHLSRGEVKESGLNVAFIALAAVAAWLATVWVG